MKRIICIIPILAAVVLSCSAPLEESAINDQLEEGKIQPELELVIEETDQVMFSSLRFLDVDSHGRVYAADTGQRHIHAYDGEGKFEYTISREGRGPGEFGTIGNMMFGAGDTLWVYDSSQLRVSSFLTPPHEDWRFLSTTNIPMADMGSPLSVKKLGSGFIVAYSTIIGDEDPQRSETTLSLLDQNGRVINDRITVFTEREMVIETIQGGMTIASVIPFSWVTYWQTSTSGDVYIAKSDSLRFEAFNVEGEKADRVKQAISYRPVTSSDREDAREQFSSMDLIPDHHPAFRNFLLDDEGGFWFNLGGSDDTHLWAVLDAEGAVRLSIELPRRLNVQAIRNGRIYGIYNAEDGPQEIRGYRWR